MKTLLEKIKKITRNGNASCPEIETFFEKIKEKALSNEKAPFEELTGIFPHDRFNYIVLDKKKFIYFFQENGIFYLKEYLDDREKEKIELSTPKKINFEISVSDTVYSSIVTKIISKDKPKRKIKAIIFSGMGNKYLITDYDYEKTEKQNHQEVAKKLAEKIFGTELPTFLMSSFIDKMNVYVHAVVF